MLVAMVTEPRSPARAMISASCSCCLALSTVCGTPRRSSMPESISEISTLMVPTSTGCPRSWASLMSFTTAVNLASFVLKIRSFWSSLIIGRCVGTLTTSVS